MLNKSNTLVIDIKAQDRLCRWFSDRLNSNGLPLTCFQLGDSDIDYLLSYKSSRIRVLNAPYQVQQIKHKLIASGLVQNVRGQINAYGRYVDNTGALFSTYNYPPDASTYQGIVPPTLSNALNLNTIEFSTIGREGYIIFLETLPTNYFDTNGNQLRLAEPYTYIFTPALPSGYEFISDTPNGSFFISKDYSVTLIGSNLFTAGANGTFETNLNNISGINGALIVQTNIVARTGTRSLAHQPALIYTTPSTFTLWQTTNITLAANKTYLIEGYIYVPTSVSGDIKINILSTSTPALLSETPLTEWSPSDGFGQWIKISTEVVTNNASTAYQPKVSISGIDASLLNGMDIYYDDFTLFEVQTLVPGTNIGTILIKGQYTGIEKTITYNY